MSVTEWVQDRFGSDDTATLLDESVYSDRELRKDKAKLEQSLRQIEEKLDEHNQKYQQLLQQGAEADEMQRRLIAKKAKLKKKKYKAKKKQHKANSIKLGTIISIEGMRDVLDTADSDINLSGHMQDADTAQLQSQIMDQMAEFGLEIKDMQQVEEALDISIIDDDIDAGASEEVEIMEEMAAGSVSKEQIDIDEEVEAQPEELGDVDIEDDIEGTLDV